MVSESTLESIKGVMTPIYFGLGCLMEAVLLYRVRCRLDFSMYFVSASFLAAFFFRLPFIGDSKEGDGFYQGLSTFLIFAMIYYFVFEMVKLKDKLESDDLYENIKRRKRTIIIEWAFFITFFLFDSCIFSSFKIIQFYYPEKIADVRHIYDILFTIKCFTTIFLDFYIIYLFFDTYLYLIGLKIEFQGYLTRYNKRAIAATVTIVGLYIIAAFITNICSSFLEISYFKFSE